MVHIAADVNANDLGIGFEVLSAMNMSFVLQRFGLSIHRMPAYNENVIIRTWPDSVSRGTFLRKGDMHDDGGQKIMEWASLWILFDIGARKILKPTALPITLPTPSDLGVSILPEKIPLHTDAINRFSNYIHTVHYAEVDTNMHMNNSIYGDLVGNALFSNPDLPARNWREVQINYLAETRLGDEIEVNAYQESNTMLVVGSTPERVAFSAKIITDPLRKLCPKSSN